MLCSVTAVVSDSWWARGLQPARPLCPWDSPGKNTGVGCHFLLQRIFLTQGSIKPVSLVSPALAAKFFTTSVTWAAQEVHTFYFILFYSIHGSLRKLKKKKKREKMAEAIHFWVLEIEIPTKWCTPGACLVVQWLRLPFQCRGYWFNPWLGSWDPTCLVAKKPNHKKQKKYCDKCNKDFKNSLHF